MSKASGRIWRREKIAQIKACVRLERAPFQSPLERNPYLLKQIANTEGQEPSLLTYIMILQAVHNLPDVDKDLLLQLALLPGLVRSQCREMAPLCLFEYAILRLSLGFLSPVRRTTMSRSLLPFIFSLVLCGSCKLRSEHTSSKEWSGESDVKPEENRQNERVVIFDQNQFPGSAPDKQNDDEATQIEEKSQAPEHPVLDRHQVEPPGKLTLVYGTISKSKVKCESKPCHRYRFHLLNLDESPVVLHSLVLPDELKKAKIESGKTIVLGELMIIGKNKKTILDVKAGFALAEGTSPNLHLTFATLENQNPQRQCYVAPCPNKIANVLNTATSFLFDNLDTHKISHVVQPEILVQNLVDGETIVMGESLPGKDPFPGGFEKIFRLESYFQKIK